MSNPTNPTRTRKANKLLTADDATKPIATGYGCIIAPTSSNSKLTAPGYVSVAASYRPVHVSRGTCPLECVYHPAHLQPDANPAAYGIDPADPRKGQCYNGAGPAGFSAAWYKAPTLEETAWSRLPHAGLFRLHVSGDFLTPQGGLDHPYIARLHAELTARPHLKTWGYTHAWRQMSAAGYGPSYWPAHVQILASVDSQADRELAHRLGWRTARGIETANEADRPREIPCPEQLSSAQGRNYPCAACQLCTLKTYKAPDIAFMRH